MDTKLMRLHWDDPRVVKYWRTLLECDWLKYRMPEIEKPGMEHCLKMQMYSGNVCFFALDVDTFKVVGDIMLNDFHGETAQSHFSMLPGIPFKETVVRGRQLLSQLFSITTPDGKRRYSVLLGCIPEFNFLAKRFIRGIGYEYKCCLTNYYKCLYLKESKQIQNAIVFEVTWRTYQDGRCW